MGWGFIILICLGKMCKNSFDLNIRKFCNPCNQVCTVFGNLQTDPAHSGINFNMDMTGFIFSDSDIRKSFCRLIFTDCRTYFFFHYELIMFRKTDSKDQNRFLSPIRNQHLRFIRSCHGKSPYIRKVLDCFCYGQCMPVSICLDDGGNFGSFFNIFMHGFHIIAQCI